MDEIESSVVEQAGAPTQFTPTHFHKNNLGGRIPLMKTPDGKFWWISQTTDASGMPGSQGIVPWHGNTENRSAINPASVDGEIQNGNYVDYPEGTTWKTAQQPKPQQSAQPAVDNTAVLAKLKRLEELVNKYNKLKPKKESAINIEQSLLESFGYTINEAGAWDSVKRVGGKIFSKAAFPVAAGLAIWEGWTQIQELPPSLSDQQRRAEITKIISKLVAEFGTFYVGAIIGGAIGGLLGGVGAIPGFIAGGVASSILLGDDVNAIVDKIVDYLYKDSTAKPTVQQEPVAKPAEEPVTKKEKVVGGDPDVVELQTSLQASGATNSDGSPLTIDGLLGPNTITAVQKELAGLGATNQDGTPLEIDGKIGPNTAAAIQKYYLS